MIYDPHKAAACRRLWAKAVATWLDDWNREHHAAARFIDAASVQARILDDVRFYLATSYGTERFRLAGVDPDPARIMALVALPRDEFQRRFKLADGEAAA